MVAAACEASTVTLRGIGCGALGAIVELGTTYVLSNLEFGEPPTIDE